MLALSFLIILWSLTHIHHKYWGELMRSRDYLRSLMLRKINLLSILSTVFPLISGSIIGAISEDIINFANYTLYTVTLHWILVDGFANLYKKKKFHYMEPLGVVYLKYFLLLISLIFWILLRNQ